MHAAVVGGRPRCISTERLDCHGFLAARCAADWPRPYVADRAASCMARRSPQLSHASPKKFAKCCSGSGVPSDVPKPCQNQFPNCAKIPHTLPELLQLFLFFLSHFLLVSPACSRYPEMHSNFHKAFFTSPRHLLQISQGFFEFPPKLRVVTRMGFLHFA